ncbi:hypothetical protein NEF87_001029 [Candidatus Lokiarchaeum ossiferum]|uniref:Fibronectin type-III domain-containing protein n=1 Tax=Candidatus Lokiarchaeum ossiferum TaxID=2951803 RepID=A0ABY6HQJ7_9ARCH|nr:hypothetical protein NEF87_001029 [Candidatus Lokiarchaeum sp. B-35]
MKQKGSFRCFYLLMILALNIIAGNVLSSNLPPNYIIPKSAGVDSPRLYAFPTRIDRDGDVYVDWVYVTGVSTYYVYRNTSQITSIEGLVPISSTTSSYFNDVDLLDGEYFYVIIASNGEENSSMSNCESVIIINSEPTTPSLYTISPSTDKDGDILIDWGSTSDTDMYYLFKDSSEITSIEGRPYYISTASSSYNDLDQPYGLYYYAVIASNENGNSTLSACRSVIVDPEEPSTPTMATFSAAVDFDGDIYVNWNDVSDVDTYYLYRNTSEITSLIGQTYHVSTIGSYHYEYDLLENTYYYAVVASNEYGNSELSNCESIQISYTVPATPVLSSFTINPDTDGDVHLDWNSISGADTYYIYRNDTAITSINGMAPYSSTSSSYFYDNDLENGNYYYVIRAENELGSSGISNCEHVQVIQSILPAPVLDSFSLEPDYDGNIQVEWDDIPETSTYYLFRSGSEILSTTGMQPLTTTSSSYFYEYNLQEGTYYYAVIASNEIGNSSLSNSEAVQIIRSVPNMPILSSISPNPDIDGIVRLSWSRSDRATSYLIYRNSTLITSLEDQVPLEVTSSTYYYDEGLDNGTYYYIVVAKNSNGKSPISNCESVLVTLLPPNAPSLSSISPNPNHDGIVNLNWNDVAEISKYYIYRSTSTIESLIGLNPIAITTSSYYDDYYLSDGTYYYVIVAANGNGNSIPSNCELVSIVNEPPEAPIIFGFSHSPDRDGDVTVDWYSINNADKYLVFRSFSNITSIEGMSPVSTTSSSIFHDYSLSDGTYYYVVVAVNHNGNSTMSNCEMIIVENCAPQPVELNSFSPNPDFDGEVEVDWGNSYDTAQYYIYRSTSEIISISGMEPVAITTSSYYYDNNLLDDTYYYVIVASNANGNSSISNCEAVSVTNIPPNAPILYEFYPQLDKDGDVEVDWNGVSDVEEYLIFRSNSIITTFEGMTPIAIRSSSYSYYYDNNLPDGTYYYVVVAVNKNGNSTMSNCEGVTVSHVPPNAPILYEFNPNPDNDGSVEVDWSSDYEADEFLVFRSSSVITSIEGMTPIAIRSSSYSYYYDNNLPDGIYHYVVIAVNENGNSTMSNCESVQIINTPPEAPRLYSFYPNPDHDGNVEVDWNSVDEADEYFIFRSTSTIASVEGMDPIAERSSSSTYFNDDNLPDGTYYYVVVACNHNGNSSISNCESVQVINTPPEAPRLSSFYPNPDHDGRVEVDWDYASDTQDYYVFRSISFITSVTGKVPIATTTSSYYYDENLPDGTYYYVIIAANKNGNSSISNCESVIVHNVPPEAPNLHEFYPLVDKDGDVKVDWNYIDEADEYHVYRSNTLITSIEGMAPIATRSPYSTYYYDYNLPNGIYYYVVVAVNGNGYSSLSQCQNVTVLLSAPDAPIVDEILPCIDRDGDVLINWGDDPDSDFYLVYRDSKEINTTDGLLPITSSPWSNYYDYDLLDGIYYYAIIAENGIGSSNLSNCVCVEVFNSLPLAPILDEFDPKNTTDYYIQLAWNYNPENTYYVYRDSVEIITIENLTPIDIVFSNNTYFYLNEGEMNYFVLVAENANGLSPMSNCVYIEHVYVDYYIDFDWDDEPDETYTAHDTSNGTSPTGRRSPSISFGSPGLVLLTLFGAVFVIITVNRNKKRPI